MNRLAGMRVLVVGLGATGAAAARVLHSLHAKVRVTESSRSSEIERAATELRSEGIEVEIGGHDFDALDADVAIVSPGIPPHADVMRALENAGVDVIGEVEVAYRLARCDFLAVTGTNGKTTTTSLLAAMLVEGGIPSLAAGNIGTPAIEAVGRVPAHGAIALEVSSFQLASIEEFRARVAVMLNVAEDHTDWHGSFDAYVAAKARIIENQTIGDAFIPNVDDPIAGALADRAPGRVVPFSATFAPVDGIGVADGRIVWREEELLPVADVPLPGRAGIEDVLAAAAAALDYGVDRRAVIRAIRGFRSLRHRLEVVADVGGIRFIDDSKATNPHAAVTAVRGLSDVVLIAGGRAKGIDLSVMGGMVPPVRAVVVMGEAADALERVFAGRVPVESAGDMGEAVRRAYAHAIPGGSVLLSPGCASLDMYKNYGARGEAFVRAVKTLIGELEQGEGTHGDA
ncbi:MAG TPA: UDP-N-acetylmuramoyl-L-alanine--D-glutamate ligase [Actinomycetota bacterium]|nr:UDP-N-acetylmuramoyl-L-alanine--D-glutamate ligase [Actinomycetota bacterium]